MSHGKWLREAAKYMTADGHIAWSNTCEQAADAYDALVAELAHKHRLFIETSGSYDSAMDKLEAAEARVQALEAALRRVSSHLSGHPHFVTVEGLTRNVISPAWKEARSALEPTQSSPAATSETDSAHVCKHGCDEADGYLCGHNEDGVTCSCTCHYSHSEPEVKRSQSETKVDPLKAAMPEIRHLLADNKPVAAMKAYRIAVGCSLRESAHAIERIRAATSEPDGQQ